MNSHQQNSALFAAVGILIAASMAFMIYILVAELHQAFAWLSVLVVFVIMFVATAVPENLEHAFAKEQK